MVSRAAKWGQFAIALALLARMAPAAPTHWELWTRYASHFVDAQGRVMDHQTEDRSTSEAQAYAMFFAVVANDRPAFDRLQRWTENNLCQGDMHSHLPAWNWGKAKDGSWGVLDPNTASDADLWMAYSLLEAGKLWNAPHDAELARAVLHLIAASEVADLPGFGPMLLPGMRGFHPTADLWLLNPSYLPVPLLLAASEADSEGPWSSIASGVPKMLEQASPNGFAMDWVSFTRGSGFAPAAAPWDKAGTTPVGSYDALRVYLWTGLSQAETEGFPVMLNSIIGMAKYMDSHMEPPEVVDVHGTAVKPDGGVGFSAALLPYLEKAGRKSQERLQLARLNAHLDEVLGLYEKDPRYYDQNLALFALGWSEHRYSFDSAGRLKVGWKR